MIEPHKSGNKLVGFYKGIVLKHENNGKCKIWIPGVYDESFKENPDLLPDAAQAAPLVTANGQKSAAYFYPDTNSYVWCFFENSDANFPVYFASINLDLTAEQYQKDEANIKFVFNKFEIEIDRNGNKAKIEHNGGKGKSLIEIDGAAGNINIEAPNKISLKSNSFNVQASTSVHLSGGGITLSSPGTITLMARTIILSALSICKIMTNIGSIVPGIGGLSQFVAAAAGLPGVGGIVSTAISKLVHVQLFD